MEMKQLIKNSVGNWSSRRTVPQAMVEAAPLLLEGLQVAMEYLEILEPIRELLADDDESFNKPKSYFLKLKLYKDSVEELLISWGMTKDEIYCSDEDFEDL